MKKTKRIEKELKCGQKKRKSVSSAKNGKKSKTEGKEKGRKPKSSESSEKDHAVDNEGHGLKRKGKKFSEKELTELDVFKNKKANIAKNRKREIF